MSEVRHPGVYIEETSALRPVEGVSTTTAAFLGFAPAGKVGVPTEVDSWQDFCHEFAPRRTGLHSPSMYMPYAVRGYFENGGRKAIVVRLDKSRDGPAQYVQEIAKLDQGPEVSMVATPETQDEQVVEAVLAQVTEGKQATYLFDAPAGMGLPGLRRFAGRFGSDYGALYYPWLKVDDRAVPSAGHVAGVIARTDLERGVYKAPAGAIAAVLGIAGTSRTVLANERDCLREAHVNWIGSLRGSREQALAQYSQVALQGAWTTGESYLSVRRALIYLERSLTRGLQQLVFERSEPRTWAKAAGLAESFLYSEYRKGGLRGRKPQEAYFVKCDATTHTFLDIEQGKVLLQAGVALMRPAEFSTMLIGIQTTQA